MAMQDDSHRTFLKRGCAVFTLVSNMCYDHLVGDVWLMFLFCEKLTQRAPQAKKCASACLEAPVHTLGHFIWQTSSSLLGLRCSTKYEISRLVSFHYTRKMREKKWRWWTVCSQHKSEWYLWILRHSDELVTHPRGYISLTRKWAI